MRTFIFPDLEQAFRYLITRYPGIHDPKVPDYKLEYIWDWFDNHPDDCNVHEPCIVAVAGKEIKVTGEGIDITLKIDKEKH